MENLFLKDWHAGKVSCLFVICFCWVFFLRFLFLFLVCLFRCLSSCVFMFIKQSWFYFNIFKYIQIFIFFKKESQSHDYIDMCPLFHQVKIFLFLSSDKTDVYMSQNTLWSWVRKNHEMSNFNVCIQKHFLINENV